MKYIPFATLTLFTMLFGTSALAQYKTYNECYNAVLPIERAELKKAKYGASCAELDGQGDYENAENCAHDSEIDDKAKQKTESFCKDYFPKSKK